MYLVPILCRNRGVHLFKRVKLLENVSTGSQITSHVYCRTNDKLKRDFNTPCPAKNQTKTVHEFDQTKFKILIRRRFIFKQSYDIYGGARGFFDLGPIGCALKTNILQFWRNFFVLEEQMLEIECPALTAESVFKASGHIQRFNDYLVKDVVTGESFRLDHLVKSHLMNLCSKTTDQTLESELKDSISKLDGYTKEEYNLLLKKYNIKSPTTGNDLTEPIEYNLMFGTQLGPSATTKGYLRPETSQGIFVNFKHLLDYNSGRLPFAVAQVGNAFRNEISPRGLLRVREFTLAEIEHFMDPIQSTHPKFSRIENHEMTFYSGDDQMNGRNAIRMTIGQAVRSGLVKNQTLGYYLARIQEFLIRIGISPDGLRFRQHMCNEMAHYAKDCWDAECLTSHGWIECVGCADRSDYDLGKHSLESGVNFSAKRTLEQPIEMEFFGISPTKEALNRFKNKQRKLIKKALSDLDMSQSNEAVKKLEKDGHFDLQIDTDEHIRLNKSEVEINAFKKTVQTQHILPCVIEPSFGIGRIMYALLEHSYRKRGGDDGNSYFALPALVAPHKCAVLPLVSKPELQSFVEIISSNLKESEILHKVDDVSGSIGRRYIRCDEIGVPISITVDYDTLEKPHTVTLRDRDTKGQLRIPIEDVSQVVRALSNEKTNWTELSKKYPSFGAQRSST